MPKYDIEQLIFSKSKENSNIAANNPEAINLAIAETTLKQYALQEIFSDEVADAHREGRVHLQRGATPVTTAGPREAFGTWALFDDEPRVATATALEPTEALRISRTDFLDVLADNVRVTEGVLKAIVRRLRALGRAVRGPAAG